MDNMTLQDILDNYLKLLKEEKETSDLEYKNNLTEKLNEIRKTLNDYIEGRIKTGNIDNDFISFVANANLLNVLSNDIDIAKNDVTPTNNDDNHYDLSSKTIKSKLTGKEIPLIGLSNLHKIELIYMHTGCIISSNDSVLTRDRDRSFDNFMSSLNRYTTVSHLREVYGTNWKEEVEKIYKQAYDRATSAYISNIVEKVDEQNINREKCLNKEFEESEQEIETLTNEVQGLKEEIAQLTDTFNQIQQEKSEKVEQKEKLQLQKEELEQYKKRINEMIINNSEDKNRFYSDGTTKPDMSDDEYSRFTTSRKNRSSETGMQQRVNDAAHVHSPLDSRDRERLQRKYEQVFSQLPITEDVVEETKPKSR